MSENLIKNSIFKQEIYRNIYKLNVSNGYSHYENKVFENANIYIYCYEKIEEKEIFTCSLEMPMLEVGKSFYIEELNETFLIRKRVLSSKGNIYYYTDSKYIDDEISIKTKEEAKLLQQQYFDKKELQEFKEQVEKSFWFKFIKLKK